MNAIRVLLRNSIDYAGLFPPAALDMDAAVGNYLRYHAGDTAWALGRFILPVSRLAELERAAAGQWPRSAGEPCLLGVLAGADLPGDLEQVARFNVSHAGRGARIDTLELKANSEEAIRDTMRLISDGLQVYLELPIDRDPTSLIAAVGGVGARAKVRTGGVTLEGFPRPENLIRFLQGCVRANVPFKATAGLHHPLRSQYRLTYAPDSPTATMFGFLNLFLAAAFLRAGMEESQATEVLKEESPLAFQFDERGVSWRGHWLEQEAVAGARRDLIVSFGSCSFTEPLEELQALNLLEPRVHQA